MVTAPTSCLCPAHKMVLKYLDHTLKEAELTTPSLQSNASRNGTEAEEEVVDPEDPYDFDNSTKDNSSAGAETSTPVSPPKTEDKTTELPTTHFSSSSPSAPTKAAPTGGSSWAYVILVLIILVIIVLCIILYLLRRASRTYTFDLQRPVPTNNPNEPTGTFEQVYLDDLEQPAPKDEVITDDISSTPVANGTTLQTEEKISNGDNTPQDQPGLNRSETPPSSDSSPSLGDEQADNHSTNSTNFFFDAVGEEQQQNENNNNPSVCSSDPFVEINLEDPALSNQLLTSPEASSSVLPFSPFSFSSSSS
ncbi:uncharacterized protein LOC141811224 [Halichoeres trimaculatus]|uniref:uncharacterized protein LOC141811224 n=1 Tax=Halichoeres trimaculatus TaxID=147232 RepID=UPI003D9F2087